MTTTQTIIDVTEVPTEETEESTEPTRIQRIRAAAAANKGKLIAAACVALGFVAGTALAARGNEDDSDTDEDGFSDVDEIIEDTDPE